MKCPEIVVNRSFIDPTKSKLIVKLEIKDINGYWKKGLSFKGMRLRSVPPNDPDQQKEEICTSAVQSTSEMPVSVPVHIGSETNKEELQG